MTEAKYTPGPWATYVNKENDVVIRKMLPDGIECCEIARVKTGFSDARLIASATELLEALKLIANAENSGLDLAYCKGIARAAIAKATGN